MSLNLILLAGALIANTGFLNPDPDVVLKEIADYRTKAIADARASGKAIDAQALTNETKAMASKAIEGVDATKVEPAKAYSWARLFQTAGKFGDIEELCDQFMKSNPDHNTAFRAHLLCLDAYNNLKQYDKASNLVQHLSPEDDSGKLTILSQVMSWIAPEIAKSKGVDAAITLIDQAASKLPAQPKDERMKASFDNVRGQVPLVKAELYTKAGEKDKAAAIIKAAKADPNLSRSAKLGITRLEIVGAVAPEITVGKTYGEFKSFEALRGKVVLIDFFAHWCGPCIAAFPDVRKMYDELKPKGLEIIGVTRYYGYYGQERNMAPETEFSKVGEFMEKHRMNWPVVFSENTAFESYGVSGIPTVVVIDRQGKVHELKVGYSAASFAEFRKRIEAML